MKKNKLLKLVACTALGVIGISASVLAVNTASYVAGSAEVSHNGYHYAAVEATASAHGHTEFWTCCECHETFLTKPETGTWAEGADATMVGGIPSSALTHYFAAVGDKKCAIEGCTYDEDTLMALADVDFTQNKFGASEINVTADNTDVTDYSSSFGKKLVYSDTATEVNYVCYNWNTFQMNLPKVDYTKYDKVSYDIEVTTVNVGSAGGHQIGFDSAKLDYFCGWGTVPSGIGCVTFNYVDGVLTAHMCLGTNLESLDFTVTDQEVVTGKKSLPIYSHTEANLGDEGNTAYVIFTFKNVQFCELVADNPLTNGESGVAPSKKAYTFETSNCHAYTYQYDYAYFKDTDISEYKVITFAAYTDLGYFDIIGGSGNYRMWSGRWFYIEFKFDGKEWSGHYHDNKYSEAETAIKKLTDSTISATTLSGLLVGMYNFDTATGNMYISEVYGCK